MTVDVKVKRCLKKTWKKQSGGCWEETRVRSGIEKVDPRIFQESGRCHVGQWSCNRNDGAGGGR
jgi:hypothetical protein